MTAVPDHELATIAETYGVKADTIVWADRNPFGLLVGFTNGTSRYLEQAYPPARSMNP